MSADAQAHDRIDELTERLVDLEVRLAFQDRALAALDDVVRALATRVEVLTRALGELQKPGE
jgi:uncharacterized coiled-coil protein SlyX